MYISIMLNIRERTFQFTFISAYLLEIATLLVQSQVLTNCNSSCNFEVKNNCLWREDLSVNLRWLRHQGEIPRLTEPGPFPDHTKGLGVLKSKSQGPGALQFRGGKCIHIFNGGFTKPEDGRRLVIHSGCGEERLMFQLASNGILIHTKHGMCVKPKGPVVEGVKIGVYRNCTKTDSWSWTRRGSLQYKKKMCLAPESGLDHSDGDSLVLTSVCGYLQNFAKFVPVALGWYRYMEDTKSLRRKASDDRARYISPMITKAKSCLQFFYRMYGQYTGKLQVYVKSEGRLEFLLRSFNGSRCGDWYQAQVAVNNQKTVYQYVIEGVRKVDDVGSVAIDDICIKDFCTEPETEQPNLRLILQLNATTPPSVQVDGKANTSGKLPIFIAANTCALLLIVVINIVVLVKCRRRNQKPKLSTTDPVNNSLNVVENLQGPSKVTEEQIIEDVELYVIPLEKETNTHEKDLNSGYDELNELRLENRYGADDGSYQELGAVMEVDEKDTGTYEDIMVYQNCRNP